MEKLQIHMNHFFPFFFLQFSSLLLFSSAYNPAVKHFINCGSDSSVNVSGRTFVGDINSDSSFAVIGKSEAINDSNPSPQTSPLYTTARIYKKKSRFELNITKYGTYMVRFHFFVFKSQKMDLSRALFDIETSNFSLLSKFSVQNNFPVIKEFFLTIKVGKLEIQFLPSSFAFVNAIEVFLLPSNFIMDNKALGVPPVPSKDGIYVGRLSDALQTVHRINVGGAEIQEANDSLWRNWMKDDSYIIFNNSAKPCSFYNGTLGEGPDAIEEIAPDLVYRTCREAAGKESDLPNITWSVNVSMNTRHLVRVHFFNVPASLDFDFHIYTTFTITDFDYPFFYNMVFDSDDSGYLRVSVAPEHYLTKLAYLNGIEIMEFLTHKNLVASAEGGPRKYLFFIIGSVGGVILISILIFLSLFVWRRRRSKLGSMAMQPYGKRSSHHSWIAKRSGSAFHVPILNLNLKISLAEILYATQNFSRKLLIGEGGFGKVYKGTLQNGKKVAVKRSNNSGHGQGALEFQTEVMVLSQIQHRHLVSFIGYCTEGSEMILVYEFMEKGTLRDHLYNWKDDSNKKTPFKPSELTWKQRLEICIGTARGLHYLHTCMDGGIIHRDVKTTNILLDEHYVAKVADFGLSQSGAVDPDHFSMGIKGSFGYLDPEYFGTLQLTSKSDVYSFGVVLLEVLCARAPIVNSSRRDEINLADWGLFWLKKGKIEKIIDPSLAGKINPFSLRKFCEIAEKCLKPKGVDRPKMVDVCWYLEYALQLQQTAVYREPHEDSTTDVLSCTAFPVLQIPASGSLLVAEGEMLLSQDDGSVSIIAECSAN